jgi:hypothetical protein
VNMGTVLATRDEAEASFQTTQLSRLLRCTRL